jgi:hypothetical protein
VVLFCSSVTAPKAKMMEINEWREYFVGAPDMDVRLE